MPSKVAFLKICKRVETDICYARSCSGRNTRSVEFQVIVVLYHLGLCGGGSGLEIVASHCWIGVGTVGMYTKRFFTVILAISEEWISWPTEEEKKDIKEAKKKRFGFPNCVSFLDGSLIELEYEPKWRSKEFYTRKANYDIQNLAVCDHNRKIRYFVTGFFGSTHDSRVFNATMGLCPKKYFAEDEYILADSAYASTTFMIPPYKKPINAELPEDKKIFYKMHSGTRIAVDCFGMSKCRFASLKKLRHQVYTEEKMADVSDWINVCVILHNTLIEEPEDKRLMKKVKRQLLLERKSRDSGERTVVPFTRLNFLNGNELRDAICEYILAINK